MCSKYSLCLQMSQSLCTASKMKLGLEGPPPRYETGAIFNPKNCKALVWEYQTKEENVWL